MRISFIQDRLLWVVRPLGLVFLVLWVLHPATGKGDLLHQALVGFLLGLGYGVVVCRETLRKCISLSNVKGQDMPNKVPDTYYWGNITNVLFDNR